NAGVEGSIVVGKVTDQKSASYGYDAQNNEYDDLIEKGIIDPAKVVRTALQDAASVAGLLVTTEAGVAEAPKKKEEHVHMPGGGMGGMDMIGLNESAAFRGGAVRFWRPFLSYQFSRQIVLEDADRAA